MLTKFLEILGVKMIAPLVMTVHLEPGMASSERLGP